MNIIYISAQPDDYYFLWQIELQISNFLSVGIAPHQISILIAFNEKRGLNPLFQKLISSSDSRINFFVCPDRRDDRRYTPSIRHFLLIEYLKTNPSLENATLFFHDSDIFLREMIPFGEMLENEKWYASDTGGYLNSQYVISAIGQDEFINMCNIVGISPGNVIANDINCGGAQYLLKGTTIEFWEKVKNDAVAIFEFLDGINQRKADKLFYETGINRATFGGIQAWCADMWSLFWNAIWFGKDVIVDSKLDFCWASEPISRWQNSYILHYTGVTENSIPTKKVFRKTDYHNFPPYYDLELFANIDETTTDAVVRDVIWKFLDDRSQNRRKLDCVTFIMPFESGLEMGRNRLLFIIVELIQKYYQSEIIILDTADNYAKQLDSVCPSSFRNISVVTPEAFNSYIRKYVKSPYLFFWKTETIIDPTLLGLEELETAAGSEVINFLSREIIVADTFLSQVFSLNLEFEFLINNWGKMKKCVSDFRSGGLLIKAKVLDTIENSLNSIAIDGFYAENLLKSVLEHDVDVFERNIQFYELSGLNDM